MFSRDERFRDGQFNTASLLLLMFAMSSSLTIARWLPSLGLFLLTLSLGGFLVRLDFHNRIANFFIHSIASTLAIISSLTLSELGRNVLIADAGDQFPPFVCFVAALSAFTTAILLKRFFGYSSSEMTVALLIVVFLVIPGIICFSIGSLGHFLWSYTAIFPMVAGIVIFPFTFGIIIASRQEKEENKVSSTVSQKTD